MNNTPSSPIELKDEFPALELLQETRSAASQLVMTTLRTAWLLDQVVAAALSPFGIHHAQFNALLLLKQHALVGVRPSTIGEFLCVSRPNVTKLLAKLQTRSLVEERPDPADGRAIRAFITPAGLSLVQDASRALCAELDGVVSALPNDDALSLHTLLNRFRNMVWGALRSGRRP